MSLCYQPATKGPLPMQLFVQNIHQRLTDPVLGKVSMGEGGELCHLQNNKTIQLKLYNSQLCIFSYYAYTFLMIC